jgi:hypothetical protein
MEVVFCFGVLCSLLAVYQCFEGTYCLHLQGISDEGYEVDGLYSVRRRTRPGTLTNQSHGERRWSCVRTNSKEPFFQGIKEEGWVRREKEKSSPLRALKVRQEQRQSFSCTEFSSVLPGSK